MDSALAGEHSKSDLLLGTSVLEHDVPAVERATRLQCQRHRRPIPRDKGDAVPEENRAQLDDYPVVSPKGIFPPGLPFAPFTTEPRGG